MSILQGPKKTFRLTAGSVKTVGRATRADFIVDAALVSRVRCCLDGAWQRVTTRSLGARPQCRARAVSP
jgi:hypothetical protein